VVEDELALGSEAAEPEEGASLITNGRLDGLGRKIVVLGAQTRLDEAAAQMVAQALRAEGAEVQALPLRTALPRGLGGFKPETVVMVSLDDTPSPAAELQLRQFRRRMADVRLGLALWPTLTTETAAPRRKGAADFLALGMEQLFAEAFQKPAAAAA